LAESSTSLAVSGLSRSEIADLLDQLPEGAARVQQTGLAQGELGEPATLLLLVALSIGALTGICAWLSLKGKNVKLALQVQGLGGVGGSFGLEITGADTPADVASRLAERGVSVPE
jgi:hypothetical protein